MTVHNSDRRSAAVGTYRRQSFDLKGDCSSHHAEKAVFGALENVHRITVDKKTAAIACACTRTAASSHGSLDRRAENPLNGGFCDAAGDHVCASPGLTRFISGGGPEHGSPAPAARSSRPACVAKPVSRHPRPASGQLQDNHKRRQYRIRGGPMRTIRGSHGPFAAGRAQINQRVQHETYLPTFRYPPQAYPWFPRAHEDPWRPRRDQRAPRQGPQAPGSLRAG